MFKIQSLHFRTFPLYRQLDTMDCGPTCLRMIAKFYGRNFSLQELRDKTSLTREGVSLLGVSEAAEAIGFRTVAAKIDLDKLMEEAKRPFIAYWNQNHFIVVYKISKVVHVADPSLGLITYTIDQFKKGWLSSVDNAQKTGVILLIEPSHSFYDMNKERTENTWRTLPYLFGHLRPHRKFMAQLLLGLISGSLLQLIFPLLTKAIVDIGINTQNIQFIFLVLVGQFVLLASKLSVDLIRRWVLLH